MRWGYSNVYPLATSHKSFLCVFYLCAKGRESVLSGQSRTKEKLKKILFVIPKLYKRKRIWLFDRGGYANFFKVCNSQIRKSLGPFRYHKSANFSGVPVRKSKIRKFLQNYAQLCLKTFIKVVVLNSFLFFYKSEL